jgi:hypothetical protein
MTTLLKQFIAVACICLSIDAFAEESLGRLFLTPDKRAMLERQRQTNAQVQETQTLQGATMHLNGIVQRSGGKKTVWINGQSQSDDATTFGVTAKIADPARASLAAEGEPAVSLKVGETVNRATRETDNGLEGGKILVGKSATHALDERPSK